MKFSHVDERAFDFGRWVRWLLDVCHLHAEVRIAHAVTYHITDEVSYEADNLSHESFGALRQFSMTGAVQSATSS